MENSTNKENLLIILGPTAVGKSRLALKISKLINSEIINCDAMQIYKGLPISTNKPTKSELSIVKHHLINKIDITNFNYSVYDFKKECKLLISDINKRNKLPILVGGTSLYCKSILFKEFLNFNKRTMELNDKDKSYFNEYTKLLNVENNSLKLYNLLLKIDIKLTNKIHFNDQRKIKRKLELYFKNESSNDNINKLTLNDKYNFKIIWLDCKQDILNVKINKRIDSIMLKDNNLINEFIQFNKEINNIVNKDKIKILQSIGYKEFKDYIINLNLLNENELKIIFEKCKLKLKLNTIKYSKKQKQWLTNFWCHKDSIILKNKLLFNIDTTLSKNINDLILKSIINNLLFNFDLNIESKLLLQLKPLNNNDKLDIWLKYNCKICNKILNGLIEYNVHLKSKKHKILKNRL